MPLRDIDAEDIALLSAAVLTRSAIVIDEIYESPFFKALKIFAALLSVGLAIQRIRTGKPFYKDVDVSAWQKVGDWYQVTVPKQEHKRGKSPTARCLTKNPHGGWSECYADASVQENGDLVVRASQLFPIRLEVRK